MVPQFNNSFFGVRYHYRQFHTRIRNDETQFSNDDYQTIEFWGGVNVGKKWQVLFFLPYNFNKQVSDDGTNKMNGFGDLATMINYSLIEKTSKNNKNQLVYQQLLIEAGIKLRQVNRILILPLRISLHGPILNWEPVAQIFF